jgi:hypothetical protein
MNDENPIIDEIRRVREELLKEFGGDLRALAKDTQRRTEEAARTGHKVVSLPPRRPEGWKGRGPAKKAG